jgi:hypothetical protein
LRFARPNLGVPPQRGPVGIAPPTESLERLVERPAEVRKLVQGRGVDANRVELAEDESIAFGAPQRLSEDFVRDASDRVVKVVVAATTIAELGEDFQRPPTTKKLEGTA